jgi:hypothetical protein
MSPRLGSATVMPRENMAKSRIYSGAANMRRKNFLTIAAVDLRVAKCIHD